MSELEEAKAEIAELKEVLGEVANELAEELALRYLNPDGTIHPAMKRRYLRDMQTVKRAANLLGIEGTLKNGN